jgi:hypothetical protein
MASCKNRPGWYVAAWNARAGRWAGAFNGNGPNGRRVVNAAVMTGDAAWAPSATGMPRWIANGDNH